MSDERYRGGKDAATGEPAPVRHPLDEIANIRATLGLADPGRSVRPHRCACTVWAEVIEATNGEAYESSNDLQIADAWNRNTVNGAMVPATVAYHRARWSSCVRKHV